MPQISPMSWILIPFLFFSIFFFVFFCLWWVEKGPYLVNSENSFSGFCVESSVSSVMFWLW